MDLANSFWCCDRMFEREEDMTQHTTQMEINAQGRIKCSLCCRSFKEDISVYQHQRAKHHLEERKGRHACLQCTKAFPLLYSLKQHQKHTGHTVLSRSYARKDYIDTFYKDQVAVDKDDRKASVAVFKETVDTIITHVRGQTDGTIYAADVRKAGSHASKTKIGQADEFDTNIPLNLEVKGVRTSGYLLYGYEDNHSNTKGGPSPKNMNVGRVLTARPVNIPIPQGHVIAEVDTTTPAHLTYKGDLIPHELQRDLYNKVSTAINELGLTNVHLSRLAHGPALTLTIVPPEGHNINVDLTPSLPSTIPVTVDGWPRPSSKQAFTQEQISAVIAAGVHLVPKGDVTWTKSYSNAEKKLMADIDVGNGCRRMVLKCLKRHAQLCRSQPKGLPGFSSHILKNQVLWSCENRSETGYWNAENVEICLMDTMADTEHSLRTGTLPDYFNSSHNILASKDKGALVRMADFLRKERLKLVQT